MNNFKQEKVIGKGSYGEVWLSRHAKDRKQYVLKKMDLRNASRRERKAAEQEAKLLSKLKHPNIVAYKDSFETDDGFLWIAMGFCEGGDLYANLKARKGQFLEERQIVEWFVQISMALQYLHERHILHRDLKTQNIFLTKTKIIKIGDLGIARVLNSSCDMATTLIGTPYYMSPELFSNKPYNHKSDVWALGCCVYEMAVLKHAFNAKDMNSLVYKILRGKMPDMPKQYSKDLTSLIKAMLNQNPAKRPSVNKILRDPYIRQNIAIFLEGTKRSRRPPSGDVSNRARTGSASDQGSRDSPVDPTKDDRRSREGRHPSAGKHRPLKHDKQRPSSGDKHRPTSGDKHRPTSGDKHRPTSGDKHRPSSGDRRYPTGSDKLRASYDEAINSPSSAERKRRNKRVVGGGETPRVVVDKHRPLPPTPTNAPSDLDFADSGSVDSSLVEKPSVFSSSTDEGTATNPNLSARQRRRDRLNDSGKSPVSARLSSDSTPRVSYDANPGASYDSGSRSSADSVLHDLDETPRANDADTTDPTLKASVTETLSNDVQNQSESDSRARRRPRPRSLIADEDDDMEVSESISVEEVQRKSEEKDMNNLMTMLDATLHMVNHSVDESQNNGESDLDVEDEVPPDVPENEELDEVDTTVQKQPATDGDGQGSQPKSIVYVPAFGEATLNSSGRLAGRIAHLRKDCIKGVGIPKLQAAYNILENIDSDTMEEDLHDLLGADLFEEYAGKIWQLKFCEDSSFRQL